MLRKGFNNLGKAFRETAQALDRVGVSASGSDSFKELWSRHRPLMALFDKRPQRVENSFVAPSASVIGEVELWDKSSIWYNAIIRGDRAPVKIGAYTNVQDGAVISTVTSLSSGFPSKVDIGNYVTIGHKASLCSCTVGNNALIGIGAVIGEGALVEAGAQVAAGSYVPPGARIPANELWGGVPAKFMKKLDEDTVKGFGKSAEHYYELSSEHSSEFLPHSNAYLDAESK